MGAETEKINVEGLDVYRQVGDALCCIEQHCCAHCMGLRDHFLRRIDGTEYVGHVSEGHQFGMLL